MKVPTALLVLFVTCLNSCLFAQGRYERDTYNRLGLRAAVAYGSINTNNFETSPALGYSAGFDTRAAIYNDFLVMYGVNFYQYKTGILVKKPLFLKPKM